MMRLLAGGQATSAFDPLSLSPLQWYDASDAATFTFGTGSKVAQWNDKSGNAYHMVQGTAALQPDRSSTINSLASVRFSSATSTRLTTATSLAYKPVTICSVILPSSGAFQNIIGTATNGFASRVTPSLNLEMLKMGIASIGSSSGTVSSTVANLASFTYDAVGAYAFYINGAASGSGTNNQTIDTQVSSIGIGPAAEFFNGDIGELLVYPSVLSAGNLTNVHNYLKGRWGTP